MLSEMKPSKPSSAFKKVIHPQGDQEEFVARPSDPLLNNPYYEKSIENPRGLVGLANLGNTCYMNAALQCMSNVPALTEFFLTCSPLVSKADLFNGVQRDKPSLSQAYLSLLQDVWKVNHRRSSSASAYVAPSKVLLAFKSAHPMFRGYHQQDSQEFLRCFMDQLHEELMEAENELIRQEEELESVSEQGSVSSQDDPDPDQDNDQEEDYETADSGVSENSSSHKSNDDIITDETESGIPGTRKRKFQSCSFNGDANLDEMEYLDAMSSRSASPPMSSSKKSPSKPGPMQIQKRKPKVSVI